MAKPSQMGGRLGEGRHASAATLLRYRPRRSRWLRCIAAAGCVVALGGCNSDALTGGPVVQHKPDPETSEAVAFRTIARLCLYGASDKDQFSDCLVHATFADMQSAPTHAREFAVGDLAKCRADAGPLCEDDPPGTVMDLGLTQEQIEAAYERDVPDRLKAAVNP